MSDGMRCAFEDVFCTLGAYESILPRYWRQENLRTRETLACIEYKNLTPNKRKARILDDIWAYMYDTGPQLRDITAGAASLKSRHGEAKWRLAARLELNLRDLDQRFSDFLKLPIAQEVLEPAAPRYY